jgi:hypothetical protein
MFFKISILKKSLKQWVLITNEPLKDKFFAFDIINNNILPPGIIIVGNERKT